MKNTKFTLFFLILVAFSAVTAEEDDNYGSMIGGIPAMTWEDGGQDFFVMFNSNLDDRILLLGESNENPQGDTCMDSSSFTLDNFHIPEDALIEKAYLVWMGAVAPDRIDEPTDNDVQLSFTQRNDSSVKLSEYITSGEYGRRLTDLPSFDFEGIKYLTTAYTDCSETYYGDPEENLDVGYFTYRADVTDFFNRIYETNKTNGLIEGTGEYYGTYTVSGLECTDHDAYKCTGSMVSAWAVFFIYRSKSIDRPKKIYLYNSLAFAYGLISTAEVRNLELAPYPELRIATMVADGDTGLTNANLPTEEISVKGITPDAEAQGAYRLTDKCNPRETGYTEIFNSVSSVQGWYTDEIECYSVGWGNSNFGIDVDTFDLDSAKNINLQAHLPKDGEGFDVNFGVNQDAVFSNFMALSVDIKGSRFNIPGESEKYSCSCPPAASNTYNDYYCQGNGTNKEFYYLIKIQNWGDDAAENVTVSDELDPQLEYVSGTTEFATKFNDYGNGTDWEPLPDKNGGKFPLSGNGVKISDRMEKCNKSTETCKDTILVRYKVRPKQGTAANYVFTNIALISDSGSDTPYKTNNSYPLKLKPGSCVSDAVCTNPTPEMCGGLKEEEPEPVEKECGEPSLPDCLPGYVCENFKCVDDQTIMCSDAEVKAAVGKNSPKSDNMIILAKTDGKQPIVVGQFTLQASGCEEEKFINFDMIKVHFDTNRDEGFEFSEPELIYDADEDGLYNNAIDTIVSSKGARIEDNYIKFTLDASMKKYAGKSLNHFLVRTKFTYKSATVPQDTSFRFYFKDADLTVNSGYDGSFVSVENGTVNFPEFYIEPTGNYFIVAASNDSPEIPPVSIMNTDIPVLQLRTKSTWEEVILRKLRIKAPGNAVKFGGANGITAVSLWVDTNKDGIGDVKIAEKSGFGTKSGEEGVSEITFEHEEFEPQLYYQKDEEKILIIYVDFDMKKADPPMYGMITIPTGGITLDSPETTIYELPVKSQVFTYDCPDGDLGCDDTETDTEPKQGELGAECYPDRTCNDGLLCRSSDNTCFEPEPVKSSGCSVLTLD
ncbi:hypothetical protein J6Z39_02020 [bacterium]|nr:hypothetical protein [bacterium]